MDFGYKFSIVSRAEKYHRKHRWIALVDLQLDAQNSYLFTYEYNTIIKILYMFQALHCSSSRGLRRNYIYDVDPLKISRVMFKTCREF
jgi:hypothetical protein